MRVVSVSSLQGVHPKVGMMATMAWYKEWFGEEYLGLYSHRDEQEAEAHIDFVERVLGELRPRAVLDLACGAGRHTAVLRRRGYRTLGVDLSLTLLAHARRLPCVAGDMRCLPFSAGAFDWVLNFFTSFGYFETERENFLVLEEIVRVLAPCGRFLIDIMNTANTLRHLQPREVQRLDDRRQGAAGREQAEAPETPGAPAANGQRRSPAPPPARTPRRAVPSRSSAGTTPQPNASTNVSACRPPAAAALPVRSSRAYAPTSRKR